MSEQGIFSELLRKALDNDEILEKEYIKLVDNGLVFFDVDKSTEQKNVAKLVTKVVDEYKKQNLSFDDIPMESKELLEISEKYVEKEQSKLVLECKDPLEKGSITFDEVAGQLEVKKDLEVNYIYPYIFPSLFKTKTKGIMLYGPPGTGKCLSPFEKVLMFDGTTKKAKDIVIGDKLMGDDSSPRNVLSTCSGQDKMYEVIPTYGEKFKVNGPHILTLRRKKPFIRKIKEDKLYVYHWETESNVNIKHFDSEIKAKMYLKKVEGVTGELDVSLEEYIKYDTVYKYCLAGIRSSVEWDEKDIGGQPYEEGKTVGDYADDFSFIRDEYKINSSGVRKEYLRGLLDSKLFFPCSGGKKAIMKEKNLCKDILFLARSLGYSCCCENISGGRKSIVILDKPKQKVEFNFKINFLGFGNYCGFCIDGNRRFLLKDFTVTHNTMLARAATADIPGAAFFAPTPGELRGKYEGETEKNISNAFKCAQEKIGEKIPGTNKVYKTSIIFIDEFDSLAGARGDDTGMRRSVNALLQAMDGIVSLDGVSVIAATNYPWEIDEAVLRRFSSRIFIDLPDDDARQWLMRSSIVKNFSLPTASKEEQRNIILETDDDGMVTEWNDSVFENLKLFGGEMYCSSMESGGMFTKASRKVDLVDGNSIYEISRTLGPNKEALDIIEKIKKGDFVDPDDYGGDSKVNFGYSASDISKMMDIAIQDSSFRALEGAFYKDTNIGDDYYVAVPVDSNLAKYKALDIEGGKYDKLELLEEEERSKILNFSICIRDIINAIKKYPSTIKTDAYIKLLNYKYLGKSPQ